MKKLLCLFLCLCMMLGTVLLFSSCMGDGPNPDGGATPPSGDPPSGDPPAAESEFSIDLAEYEIVYGNNVSADAAYLDTLIEVCREKFGVTLPKSKDRYSKVQENDNKEILIGNTARVETKAVKDQMTSQYAYGISVTDHKIVICATDEVFLESAVQHFIQNYLEKSESDGAVVKLSKDTVVTNSSMEKLAQNGSFRYTIVYDRVLDVDSGNCPEAHGPAGLDRNPDQVDYPVHLARTLAKDFAKRCGVSYDSISLVDDTGTEKGRQLYMGYVNRADAQAILATLDVNQYGVFTSENRIMILAWNDNMLQKAYDYFFELIDRFATRDNKGYVYALPTDLFAVRTAETDWAIDFPKPEAVGLKLAETVDVYDKSLEYIYTGKGATAESYLAYCERLEAEGYVLNNKNVIEQSIFRTYVNQQKGIVLHVTFADYAHMAGYYNKKCAYPNSPGGGATCPQWPDSIRIVSAPLAEVNVLDSKLLNKNQSYTKRTDPMFTSINQEGDSANGYIYTLEDGSFVICDAGRGTKNTTAEDLYNLLVSLFKRTHGGVSPSKNNPIVIAGWFLSHSHGDHSGLIQTFSKAYGNSDHIKVEYCFANLSSEAEQFNASTGLNIETWKSIWGAFANKATCIKVHSGYKFYLRNMEFEILYTHEDMHPHMLDYFNETSTVFRATVKNNVANKSTTILMTGDMNRYTGYNLCTMYGSYLRSDMMTVAHHGWAGPYEFFYNAVQPKVLWWPNSSGNYKNMAAGKAQYGGDGVTNHLLWYQSYVDKYIANDLASVKYIFVADTLCHTLVFRPSGVNYANLLSDMFDAMTWTRIEPKKNVTIVK